MKSNSLVFIFVMGTTIHSMMVFGGDIIPRVIKFYRMRNIASVNFFLCDEKDRKFVVGSAESRYSEFLINWNFEKPGKITGIGEFGAQHYKIGMLFDLACQSSWDALVSMSENLLFNGSYACVLISHERKDTTVDALETLRIQFDSDVTLFEGDQIYDIFRTGTDRSITAVHCGHYGAEDKMVTFAIPPRWNLDEVTVNATTVIKEFNWEEDGIDKFLDHKYHPEIDGLSRFSLVAHQNAEYLCNFKTNLTTSPDWGYFKPGIGHFDQDSMFGWLEQGKVDFGLSLSRLFAGRLTIAFYTPVTFTFGTSVIFRHPPAGASYDGFARPFSSETWLVMGVFIFMASLVLNVITRRADAVDDPPNEPGYARSLLNVLAIISLQGSYISSMRVPTRVLSVAMHVFGLLLYSYYGAEIVGFLLSPSPRTITSVEKLVENRMDMWVENVSFHRNHFESKVSESATKYYELGIKRETRDKDKFMDMKAALRMVRKGGVSLYGQNAEMYKVIENTFSGPEICSLHSLHMLDLPVAVTVRKKSPYREIYYKALSRFIESGILDVENRRWHTRRPVCIGAESTSPVKLEATLIAQLIFTSGVCLTILMFLAEKSFPPKRIRKQTMSPRNESCY